MPLLVKAAVVKWKRDAAAHKVPTVEQPKPISILINDGSRVGHTSPCRVFVVGQGMSIKYY
jgi:hypothetical protein